MGEYAPSTLVTLGKNIAKAIPGGTFSGVLGDNAHSYGYHRARNVLPASDYSRTLKRDKSGDGWAASAVDVSFTPKSQRLVTRRLLDAAKAKDPRLKALREFFGSLDSKKVRGYDLAYHSDSNQADNSHLWHVHLSIFRKYANDAKTVAGILSVIKGDDMSLDKKDAKTVWSTDGIVPAPPGSSTLKTNPHWKASYYVQRIGQEALYNIPDKLKKLQDENKDLKSAVSSIETKLDKLIETQNSASSSASAGRASSTESGASKRGRKK